jgi:acid phosphatase (class A)
MTVLLAQMIPEKREELFARGWKFALNRVVGGVHYRSDVEAGRIAGTVLACEIFKSPSFKKEFEKARVELRGALGYPIER